MAADIYKFVTDHDLKSVVLVGHSLGGNPTNHRISLFVGHANFEITQPRDHSLPWRGKNKWSIVTRFDKISTFSNKVCIVIEECLTAAWLTQRCVMVCTTGRAVMTTALQHPDVVERLMVVDMSPAAFTGVVEPSSELLAVGNAMLNLPLSRVTTRQQGNEVRAQPRVRVWCRVGVGCAYQRIRACAVKAN